MKKLLLLRHAKSDITPGDTSDHERPINSRGIKNCAEMSRIMKKNRLIPDSVLSSTARRAVETAGHIVSGLDIEIETNTTNRLYLAHPEKHIREISKTDDSVNTLLVVGHNPAIGDLINTMSSRNEKIRTCTLAVFDLDIESWKEINLNPEVSKFRIYYPEGK